MVINVLAVGQAVASTVFIVCVAGAGVGARTMLVLLLMLVLVLLQVRHFARARALPCCPANVDIYSLSCSAVSKNTMSSPALVVSHVKPRSPNAASAYSRSLPISTIKMPSGVK